MATVLIPWRAGCPHREAALRWLAPRLPWPVVVGEHGHGDWRKAIAVEDAVRRCTDDVLVVHDADVWCDGLPDAVAEVESGAPWAVPHYTVRRLTEAATSTVLAGGGFPAGHEALSERPYRGHLGGGIVVLTRSVWETTPLDPRFVGWGHEDDGWAMALAAMHGPPRRGDADLWHLWHPPQRRQSRTAGSGPSVRLFRRYRAGRRNPTVLAGLAAEARSLLEAP